jgi:anti-anti-sigma regulatory factor
VPNTNHIPPAGNPRIEIIEVIGGLIGNGALEIQSHLYKCLDEGRCYHIIDLKHAHKIDGVGIALLENILSREVQLRLINVKPEIQCILEMAKKEALFQIMSDEKDQVKAMSSFKRDIMEKRVATGNNVLKKRDHVRVNTSFPSEFKFRRDGRTLFGRADILNLSQGGVLAGHIVARKKGTEEIVRYPGIIDQEIYDLQFRLNGNSTSLTLRGTCVREFTAEESIYAGIRLKDVSHDQREIIRSFVDAHK